MKFMKLGSRPDTFYTTESTRSVSSEVSSDLIIQVKGTRYLLHKFPLLSKCLRLQRLFSESRESSQQRIIELPDFPGGVEAFELCAKFCYGITITLSGYNIVAVRCAAEYLQMTEDVEKGNLIYKIEVFFNSCLLQGWRDSILTLQTTKAFSSWSEDLGITSRCIEAIASKVLAHPAKVSLSHSHSYSRRVRDVRDDISCNGSESTRHKPTSSKGWWGEDIAELGIDLYWRTMIAIKSGGKVPSNLIGDAFRIYAAKWLPSISKHKNLDRDSTVEITSKHRLLLESIISLLPAEKGSASCRFLSQLLKAANILNASASSKMELARRIAIQLEDATVNDLLIPCTGSSHDTVYDIDIVMTILEQFLLQVQSPPTSPQRVKKRDFERRRSRSAENIDFEFQESRRSSSASHSSKLKVAKLVDRYLQEIAHDVNLPLSKFITISEAIPEFSRLDHDDIYKAINIYLKEHPGLNKSERKRLCRILDCKKLSMEACKHAAQNDLLPLRVVVQVLFYEHARAAKNGQVTELPNEIKLLLASRDVSSRQGESLSKKLNLAAAAAAADDQWSVSGIKSPKLKQSSTIKMKLDEDDDNHDLDGIEKSSMMIKAFCLLPNRPKKMLNKLWSNKNAAQKN